MSSRTKSEIEERFDEIFKIIIEQEHDFDSNVFRAAIFHYWL